MKTGIKKALLASTAIVAMSFVSAQAQAANGQDVAVTTVISANVPAVAGANNGAAAGADAVGVAGGHGVAITAGADTDLTTSGTITITGGNGSAGGVAAAVGKLGGLGGDGINDVTVDGTSVTVNHLITVGATTTVTAGNGGNGSAGAATNDGGAGNAGGIGVALDSNFGKLTGSGGAIHGGNGGNGGNATGAGNHVGGAAGAGGDGVKVIADTVTVTNSGAVTGGNGGTGGDGVGAGAGVANGGAGGNGGSAYNIAGTSPAITINGNATGGNGGTGGAAVGALAVSGAGGAGNWGVNITGGTGANVTIGTNATVMGGEGGAAGAPGAGVAGATGNARGGLRINGATGGTITNNGTILSNLNGTGGAGAAKGVGVTVQANTTSFINTGTVGRAAGHVGNAFEVTGATTLGLLNNTNGDILTTAGDALVIGAGGAKITTINNTSGNIKATTGAALVVGVAADVDTITNTTGLITSANIGGGTNATVGTVSIAADLGAGGLAITGGSITNTGGAAGNVFDFITADQSGIISFAGVTVANTTAGASAFDLHGRDAALTFDATTAVTGNIISAAGGKLTLVSSGAIAGNVTTNDQADSLSFGGGTLVGTTDLGAGANTMAVTGTFGTGGTFAATGGSVALTVANGGTFTVNNAFASGAGATAIATGGRLNVSGANLTSTGAITNDGTLFIGVGRTMSGASLQAGAAGAHPLIFQVGAGNTEGLLALTGNLDFTNQVGSVTVVNGNTLTAGDSFIVATFATKTGNLNSVADSFLYDFTTVNNAANVTVNVTAVTTLAAASTSSNNLNAATVVQSADAGIIADPQMILIRNNLGNAATQTIFNETAEATQPPVDGAGTNGAVVAMDHVVAMSGDRLAALRSGDTGVAAGSMGAGQKTWVQAFGSMASQDRRDGIDGYDSDTVGGAVGFDTGDKYNDSVFGASLSYGFTDADSENATTTNTEVQSAQVALYGEQKLSDAMFVNGVFGYGYNMLETERHNVGGVAGLTANGDFNAHQFAALAALGRDYHGTGGMVLTPVALAQYTHLSTEGYTETGAGGANLRVDTDALNVFQLGLGVDAKWQNKSADGSYFEPSVHAKYRYDVVGDRVETSSTFLAGGAAFTTQGYEAARSTFNTGLGLSYYMDNWEVSADYDYEFKPDFDAHSGVVRAAYHF